MGSRNSTHVSVCRVGHEINMITNPPAFQVALKMPLKDKWIGPNACVKFEAAFFFITNNLLVRGKGGGGLIIHSGGFRDSNGRGRIKRNGRAKLEALLCTRTWDRMRWALGLLGYISSTGFFRGGSRSFCGQEASFPLILLLRNCELPWQANSLLSSYCKV